MQAIKLGGEWFINNQNDQFIYYEYDSALGTHPDKTSRLRELGALWAITEIYQFTDDKRYSDLANKGFSLFEKYFKYDEKNDFYFLNITPEDVTLGYSAFIILALLDHDYPKKDFYLEKFANGILHQQSDDGSFRSIFFSDKPDKQQDYYPGEALLALISLYEQTHEQKYLDSVEKALPHYKDYFRENPNTAFVPWQSRAYKKLYDLTGNEEAASFVLEMNDYMLSVYTPKRNCSQFKFAGIVTAVHMEGVVPAWKVANSINDEYRQRCYSNFISEASDFLLTLQNPNASTKKEAIGGFVGDIGNSIMRSDRNQHAVMGLMEAYDMGIIK